MFIKKYELLFQETRAGYGLGSFSIRRAAWHCAVVQLSEFSLSLFFFSSSEYSAVAGIRINHYLYLGINQGFP